MRNLPAMHALSALVFCASVAGPAGAGTAADGVFADGFEDPFPTLRYSFEGTGTNTGSLAGYDLTLVDATFGAGKVGQGIVFGPGAFASVAGMRSSLGTYARVTVGFWLFETTQLSGQAFWDTSNRTVAPYGGVQLGQTGSSISVCVSSTTSAFVGGSCGGFNAPSTGAWHHWILRYDGIGTGSGQGGPVEIYVDDVLVHTRPNDLMNDPVFNSTGMRDVMGIAGSGATMDELVVYPQVFTRAEQCTRIIGGMWTGSSCTLP